MRDGTKSLLTSGHFRHLLHLYDSLPWRVKQAAYFSPDVLVPSPPHTVTTAACSPNPPRSSMNGNASPVARDIKVSNGGSSA